MCLQAYRSEQNTLSSCLILQPWEKNVSKRLKSIRSTFLTEIDFQQKARKNHANNMIYSHTTRKP